MGEQTDFGDSLSRQTSGDSLKESRPEIPATQITMQGSLTPVPIDAENMPDVVDTVDNSTDFAEACSDKALEQDIISAEVIESQIGPDKTSTDTETETQVPHPIISSFGTPGGQLTQDN